MVNTSKNRLGADGGVDRTTLNTQDWLTPPEKASRCAEPEETAFFTRTRLLRARIRHADSIQRLSEVTKDIHLRHSVSLEDVQIQHSEPENAKEVLAELGMLGEIADKMKRLTRSATN
jgi:hypothetical protein